ncbi:MAG: DoxX family multipass rane protein [Herminiimonas sp.]|nr:DoxX family multipass rane protein [Herminiimonas sp.]
MRPNILRRHAGYLPLAFVFVWFLVGGIAHFANPGIFLKIVPPDLPLRLQAVYVSGFFALAGAVGLLHPALRRPAGIGLFALTVAVTPANVYMWRNPGLFPSMPESLLLVRLFIQAALLGCIWWAAIRQAR